MLETRSGANSMKNLFILCLFFAIPAWSQVPQKTFATQTFAGKNFDYAVNYPLDQVNARITQAVLVVHGSALNFETYFNTQQTIANQSQLQDNIVIVAPHYRTNTEKPLAPASDLLFTDEGWLSGDAALNAPVSAFTIIDTFLKKFADKKVFPNLKTIVLTGHSAGGQLTQRYAIGTQIEKELSSDIHIRYVVANPGSYAYLTRTRAQLDSTGTYVPGSFFVPQDKKCDYNGYKYGLDNLNPYMNQLPYNEKISRYIEKDIIYLIGSEDKLVEDFDLSCQALYQGPYRYLRAVNFKATLDFVFPENKHKLSVVPGIGHTQWGMYTSENGKKSILQGF